MARYIKSLRKEVLSLAHASGYEHPCQFTGDDIEYYTGINEFSSLSTVLGYKKETTDFDGMQTLLGL